MDIKFPPQFCDPFERRMYIVKLLHDRNLKVTNIADGLWISERTIEDDIAELRSPSEITIMEQTLKAAEVERAKGL